MTTFLSSKRDVVEEGDTVILYLKFGLCQPVRVARGSTVQMKYGALRHEFIIGKPYGSKVTATRGFVYILRPTCSLWTQSLPHRTQIIYPHDISLILSLLEVAPGSRIAEAGMGSAAVSHAFVKAVAPKGHLYTYEIDPGRHAAGKEEMAAHGLASLVTVSLRDVCSEGFGEAAVSVDGVFLDLPSPWSAIPHAAKALRRSGGRIVAFSPCTEQVSLSCQALRANGFTDIKTVELVPRNQRVASVHFEQLDEAADDGPFVQESSKRKRKLVEEGEETAAGAGVLVAQVAPAQQPTHTGYLTSASLFQ